MMAELDRAELRHAVSGPMIDARYQPIVALDRGVPLGIETLARLNHPQHGFLGADAFVPQLEAAGLSPELTHIVADRAFSDFTTATLDPRLRLGLNLPLDVLMVPATLGRLDGQRRAAGLAPERIVLELTESRPVRDPHALSRAIGRLREAGYAVAIDDVSPAVPHYAAMLEMPFSIVKLDKSIVQSAHRDREAADFLRSVVNAADRRGMTVIAEGVEDAATWTRMRDAGVDGAQGFLVSRPLAAAAVPEWLRDWRGPPPSCALDT